MIAFDWVISGLLAIAYRLLVGFKETYDYGISVFRTFCSILPLIICVSYTSIVIKVRCGVRPQHHGAASRKLTMTLLIVTAVSVLSYLPHVIWL